MHFPIANIDVNPLVPPLVAFSISFFTCMGGVSGAFLLLPFQMSVLGFTTPAVSSTNQLFNIVAIPSGVWRYIREGRMVWPLTWIVVVGTLPGVFIGAIVRVKYLPDPGAFKVFAGLVLLYIGVRLAKDLFKKAGPGSKNAESRFQEMVKSFKARQNAGETLPCVSVCEFSGKEVSYDFYGERFSAPTAKILAVSLVVGVIGGIYGIGGGAIMAPIYVTFFKLPVYTVAGAALMGTFITSVAGVLFYQIIAPFYPTLAVSPDWTLGLLFGLGGLGGMYCGARAQKYIPAKYIKVVLAVSICFLAVKYLLEYFK